LYSNITNNYLEEIYEKYSIGLFSLMIIFSSIKLQAQANSDTTKKVDLFADIDNEAKAADANTTDYATATFKSTRIVNGHSIETIGKIIWTLEFLTGLDILILVEIIFWT